MGTAGIAVPGSRVFRTIPTRIRGGLLFQSMSAGTHYTCAVAKGGRAYCWGNNAYGQLGTGTDENSELPTPVAGEIRFKTVSAGDFFTCGISDGDSAFCWGSPGEDPGWRHAKDKTNKPRPVAGHKFRSVSPNKLGACGVTTAGDGVCWVAEEPGAGAKESFTPTAVGTRLKLAAVDDACLLAVDGSVHCWVESQGSAISKFQPVAAVPKLRAISAGIFHNCGITFDDAAYCWGLNETGALGNGSKLAPTRRSTWTAADRSPPAMVAGGLKFQSVSVGPESTCGVTLEGVAYCWGVLGAVFDDAEDQKDYGLVPTRVLELRATKPHDTSAPSPSGR
jgi:hypothetical protein